MKIVFGVKKIIQNLKKRYYTNRIKKQCKRCGKNLHVGHMSNVTANTILKNNVSFNGMDIRGGVLLLLVTIFTLVRAV